MSKKILVVEDESQLVKVYREKLTKEGYVIDSASTFEEALTKLIADGYGLIILDIMLPGNKNGFDLLEKMKQEERFKNIPVMVLTNLDSEEKTAKEIGANMYLIKADTPIEEVVEKVNSFFV
jgi:DNA-binding response OmpR family regulator